MKEDLAEQMHIAWINWMGYLFHESTTNADGSVTIPSHLVDRLVCQMNTCYEDLTEEEKAPDQKEADKTMAVIRYFYEREYSEFVKRVNEDLKYPLQLTPTPKLQEAKELIRERIKISL